MASMAAIAQCTTMAKTANSFILSFLLSLIFSSLRFKMVKLMSQIMGSSVFKFSNYEEIYFGYECTWWLKTKCSSRIQAWLIAWLHIRAHLPLIHTNPGQSFVLQTAALCPGSRWRSLTCVNVCCNIIWQGAALANQICQTSARTVDLFPLFPLYLAMIRVEINDCFCENFPEW